MCDVTTSVNTNTIPTHSVIGKFQIAYVKRLCYCSTSLHFQFPNGIIKHIQWNFMNSWAMMDRSLH